MILTLNDENFISTVSWVQVPVLVKFSASWCKPCATIAPILKELHGEANGEYAIFEIDADEALATVKDLKIRNVPTIILFKYGKEVARMTGAANKAKILAFIKQ